MVGRASSKFRSAFNTRSGSTVKIFQQNEGALWGYVISYAFSYWHRSKGKQNVLVTGKETFKEHAFKS